MQPTRIDCTIEMLRIFFFSSLLLKNYDYVLLAKYGYPAALVAAFESKTSITIGATIYFAIGGLALGKGSCLKVEIIQVWKSGVCVTTVGDGVFGNKGGICSSSAN